MTLPRPAAFARPTVGRRHLLALLLGVCAVPASAAELSVRLDRARADGGMSEWARRGGPMVKPTR